MLRCFRISPAWLAGLALFYGISVAFSLLSLAVTGVEPETFDLAAQGLGFAVRSVGTTNDVPLGASPNADLDGRLDLYVCHGHVYPQIDSIDSGSSFRAENGLYRNVGDGTSTGEQIEGVALSRVASSIGASGSNDRPLSAGAIAGPIVEFDLRTFYLRDLTFTGSTVIAPEVTQNLVRYIERGAIRPVLAATYPLEELHAAQTAFIEKRHTGNIVVCP